FTREIQKQPKRRPHNSGSRVAALQSPVLKDGVASRQRFRTSLLSIPCNAAARKLCERPVSHIHALYLSTGPSNTRPPFGPPALHSAAQGCRGRSAGSADNLAQRLPASARRLQRSMRRLPAATQRRTTDAVFHGSAHRRAPSMPLL